MNILKASKGRPDARMKFVMLALTGKGKSFDKVLKMIDNMIALLGRESQLDSSEDKAKSLDQTLSDLDKAMESAKETTATLSTEIAALIAGVKALDKWVQEPLRPARQKRQSSRRRWPLTRQPRS